MKAVHWQILLAVTAITLSLFAHQPVVGVVLATGSIIIQALRS